MKSLKNSFNLLSFYCNDALKGFLNRPFFKKKVNRYFVAVIGFVLYFWYFLVNIKEVGKLGTGARGLDLDTLTELTRITIMSYVNMCIILSIALYVFVNSIISLTRSSIYISSILPYSRREILTAQKLFKMGVALIAYEAILVIVFPLFGQLPIVKITDQFMLLFLFHIIFVTVFLSVDFCYALVAKVISKTKISISTALFSLDSLFTLLCASYLIYFKIGIDTFIGKIPFTITTLIIVITGISLIVLGFTLYLSYKWTLTVPEYKRLSYGVPKCPIISLNLSTTFPAIYRHKSFIHSFILVIIFSSIISYQTGLKSGLETFANLNALIVISAIHYADATSGVRKYFNFYRISLIRETVSLLLVGVIFSIAPLIISIYFNQTPLAFFMSLAIYFSALIAGLLFPSTQGNLNETASTTTTIFVSVLLYLLLKIDNFYLSISIVILLVAILMTFLNKERKA